MELNRTISSKPRNHGRVAPESDPYGLLDELWSPAASAAASVARNGFSIGTDQKTVLRTLVLEDGLKEGPMV